MREVIRAAIASTAAGILVLGTDAGWTIAQGQQTRCDAHSGTLNDSSRAFAKKSTAD